MSATSAQPKPSSGAACALADALGYKRTDVGVIPADWHVQSFDSLFKVSGGISASRAQLSTTGHCYLHYGDIHTTTDTFVDVRAKYLDLPKLDIPLQHVPAKCLLQDGDVVFVDASEDDIGASRHIVVVNDGDVPFISGLHTIVAKSRAATLDKAYRRYCFQTSDIRRQFSFYAVGTKVTGISKSNIKKLRVPIPPPPEQRAIAEALSDVDGLLGALEALIAKKRAIKQAAMQQLLTGRTRLPGFSGEWETKRLGEIGSFSKGRGIKRDEVSDEGAPCIRYGELYTRYHNYIITPVSRIPVAVADCALPIRTGDLLFAGSGETAEEIGRCAAYLGDERAYAGGDIVVLTPSGQDSMYLGHLMNQPLVAAQKARFGQGDAVVHISAQNLAQVEIDLPPVDEQAAIATVLSDMDDEIAALERRRDKTGAIKQGMMQQLLTGRIRLIKPLQGQASA